MPVKQKPKEEFDINRAMAWNEKNMDLGHNELLFQYALDNKLCSKLEILAMREGLVSKDKARHDKALRAFSYLVKDVQEDLGKLKKDGALGGETSDALKKYAVAQEMKAQQKADMHAFKEDAKRQKRFEDSFNAKGPQGGPSRTEVLVNLKPREKAIRPGEVEFPGEKNPVEAAKEFAAAHVKTLTPKKTEAVTNCSGTITLVLDDNRRIDVTGSFFYPGFGTSLTNTAIYTGSENSELVAQVKDSVDRAFRLKTAKINTPGVSEELSEKDRRYLLDHTVAVQGEFKKKE